MADDPLLDNLTEEEKRFLLHAADAGVVGDRRRRASFELEPPSQEEMSKRVQNLLIGDFPFLVGAVDGQVIGYTYAGPYRTRPAYRSTVENSIYLQDNMRNRGDGKQLLSKLIEDATVRGFRQMVAVIGDSQNRGSIALHAATGFVHVGTLKSVGYKHARWLDTTIMQRSHGEGDRTPRS